MCESNVELAVIRVLYAYIKGFPVDHQMLASTSSDITRYTIEGMLYHPLVCTGNTLLIILGLCTVNSTEFKENSPKSICC
jgi:hypothetical protein